MWDEAEVLQGAPAQCLRVDRPASQATMPIRTISAPRLPEVTLGTPTGVGVAYGVIVGREVIVAVIVAVSVAVAVGVLVGVSVGVRVIVPVDGGVSVGVIVGVGVGVFVGVGVIVSVGVFVWANAAVETNTVPSASSSRPIFSIVLFTSRSPANCPDRHRVVCGAASV